MRGQAGQQAESFGECARGLADQVRRLKTRTPSLAGVFNSPWFVPPRCEYGNWSLLREGFSSVNSELNMEEFIHIRFAFRH